MAAPMPPVLRPRATFKLTSEGGVAADYQVALLPPFVQHRLLTKVLPPVAARAASSLAGGAAGRVSAELVGHMISALADISPKDHDEVIDTLLGTVSRRSAGEANWASIWLPNSKTFLFDDIGLDDMYKIIMEVVEHTYGNFFARLMATMAQASVERAAAEASATTQ